MEEFAALPTDIVRARRDRSPYRGTAAAAIAPARRQRLVPRGHGSAWTRHAGGALRTTVPSCAARRRVTAPDPAYWFRLRHQHGSRVSATIATKPSRVRRGMP